MADSLAVLVVFHLCVLPSLSFVVFPSLSFIAFSNLIDPAADHDFSPLIARTQIDFAFLSLPLRQKKPSTYSSPLSARVLPHEAHLATFIGRAASTKI